MSIVAPLGSAYAMMLQIAVYPYLLCSLLYGLGQLTPERAKRLFRASWSTYLFMWIVTLASIWILARAIPPTPLPSVLTTDSQRTEVEFFNLLIPAVSEMGCKDSCNGLICNIGASIFAHGSPSNILKSSCSLHSASAREIHNWPRPRPGLPVAEITFAAQYRRGRGFATVSL